MLAREPLRSARDQVALLSSSRSFLHVVMPKLFGLIPIPGLPGGRPLERSGFFTFAARRVFKQGDLDGSGYIDAKELYITLLLLYDRVNKSLPVHLDVPNQADVTWLLNAFSLSRPGELSEQEFVEMAKMLLGRKRSKDWRKTLWWRVLSTWAMKAALFPAVGYLAKRGAEHYHVPVVPRLPTAVVSYAAEYGVGMITAVK